MQILSRDEAKQEQFDYGIIDFAKPLRNLTDYVTLRIDIRYLESFLSDIDWSSHLSSSNDLHRSFAFSFFSNLTSSCISDS